MSVLLETTFTNKDDTRAIVDEVVEHAFESVCSTMGPNGNFVVINNTNRPKVTKDGVSVAKALDFNEARRNLIAKIITEPSIKTDREVGDGTTTTVFQTYHLYQMFKDRLTFKNMRYLDGLIRDVKKYIGGMIIPGDIHSDEFRRMLMTSSNYEEIIVEKMLEIYKTHQQPNIMLRKAPALKEDAVELTKEIFFEASFGNDAMTPPGNTGYTVEKDKNKIILIDASITTINEESLATITNVGYNCITLLIARNFDMHAINTIMQYNQSLGRGAILPIKLHAAGSLGTATFNDLGELLGARPIYDLRAVQSEDVKSNLAGFVIKANGIYIDKEEKEVSEVADKILADLDIRYDAMTIIDRQTVIGRELFRRISRLRANNVTIMVTGVTDSDAMERYYRYEDVMKAASTGLQYGVLPGIGYAYMQASKFVRELPEQSDEGCEELRQDLADLLTYQYTHLTGIESDDAEFGKFIDLVTGEVSDVPTTVYDNAAATMIALEGAWATAKTLGKINNVMGRSNQSY